MVAAPTVKHHHTLALVPQALMEVGVPKIVLVTIIRHQLGVHSMIVVIRLGGDIAPVLDGVSFLLLAPRGDKIVLVEHVHEVDVHDTDTVVARKDVGLPVNVAWKIFDGSHRVLEPSPLLGFITRLLGLLDEFCKVTVGFSHQCTEILNFDSMTYRAIMSARSLMLGTP